jgi:hypothetical protein
MTTTTEGDSGYVVSFTANEALNVGEVVEFFSGGSGLEVRKCQAVADTTDTWTGGTPVGISNVKTHGVVLAAAAINTPVKVCLFGVCNALVDTNVAAIGGSLVGSEVTNGILTNTFSSVPLGLSARMIRNGGGGGPTYLAKVLFLGSPRGV